MPHVQKTIFAAALLSTWYLSRTGGLFFDSWFSTLFIVEAGLFTLRLVYSVILYPRFFSPIRNIPGPTGGSFINGQASRIRKDPSGLPHREWVNTIPNDGLIRYMNILGAERLLVTSPEAHREVLTQKNYEYVKPPRMMGGLIRILGRGVLVVEGDEHRHQRKNLMPAFAFRHIKDLYGVFWDKTRDLVTALDSKLKDDPSQIIDISNYAGRVTLDIIGVACMGRSFNAIEDPNGELASCYRDIFMEGPPSLLGMALFALVPFWLLARIPSERNRKLNAASKFLNEYCGRLVAEKRQRLADGKQSDVDILSVAIESGGFTDKQLCAQTMTFLAAGHETTSTALTWTLLFLCQHPEIQARLRRELKEAKLPNMRDSKSTVTPDVLDHIPYLNAVCNESLRFMPPVPMTMRQSAENNTIAGQFVPAGTLVIVAPMAINFDRKQWGDDVEEFNPERWLGPGRANSGGADSNYAFMSFLHGPRSCIGQNFAKAEFASLLAGVISSFEVELADPSQKVEIQGGITQRVKGGLKVRMTPVKV